MFRLRNGDCGHGVSSKSSPSPAELRSTLNQRRWEKEEGLSLCTAVVRAVFPLPISEIEWRAALGIDDPWITTELRRGDG